MPLAWAAAEFQVLLSKDRSAAFVISKPLARHSVTLAVAVLSEGNVTTRIEQKAEVREGDICPVCSLQIRLVPKDDQKRCLYCKLPGALWNLRAEVAAEVLKEEEVVTIPPST